MMSRAKARNMQRIFINVLYVNKQEFSASSWRSNQGAQYYEQRKYLDRSGLNAMIIFDCTATEALYRPYGP